jgi:hypothetical protein
MTDAGSHPITYTGYYDDKCRPVRGVVPVEELALGFLFNEGLIG